MKGHSRGIVLNQSDNVSLDLRDKCISARPGLPYKCLAYMRAFPVVKVQEMVRIQFPFYVGRKWIAQQHSELEIMTALFETRHFSWAWSVSALLTLLSVVGDRPLDSPTREYIAREFQGLRDWTEDGHTVLPERILDLIETRIDERMAACEKASNRSMIRRA